jgi:hypothetical protein
MSMAGVRGGRGKCILPGILRSLVRLPLFTVGGAACPRLTHRTGSSAEQSRRGGEGQLDKLPIHIYIYIYHDLWGE